jgi:monofunctional biosynthetic peptidoglycan transglycosylase
MSPPRVRILRRILLIAVLVLALPYAVAPFYAVGQPVSALMMWRRLTGQAVERRWIALEEMAPALPRSVVAAEDARFCSHRGIDWNSLQDAIEDAQDGEAARGGSTISQQLAKNLFLWPGRSVVRKALEAPLALWIDLVLGKSRVLEVYLNVAEMGPSGEFGAEAGAQAAFGRSAADLSAREAALLAASLPNPVARNAARPGRGLLRLAGTYAARAQAPALQRCWEGHG